MAYGIDPIQASCYPGTTVFLNKLDIRDETALNILQIEQEHQVSTE